MTPLRLILALALYCWSASPGYALGEDAPSSAPAPRVEDQAPKGDAPAAAEPTPVSADPDSQVTPTPPAGGEAAKEPAKEAGAKEEDAQEPPKGAAKEPAKEGAKEPANEAGTKEAGGNEAAKGAGDSPKSNGEPEKAAKPEDSGPPPAAPPGGPTDLSKKPTTKRTQTKTPLLASAATKDAKPPVAAPDQGPAPPSESDRVTHELFRTDRAIALAKRRVEAAKNGRAQKAVASALDFQADAREAFKVRQYARAERLTLAAREYADRAARMVGPPREDPEFVESVLKRTDDALDRANDVMKNGAGAWAWKRHEALKDSQKDAWKAYKDGAVGDAYQRSLAVRRGVLDLLGQLEELPVPRETAEKAINGARAALERTGKDLGKQPTREAARFIGLANTYIDKAQYSFNRKSYRAALLQAKVAEQNLEKAIDAARPRS